MKTAFFKSIAVVAVVVAMLGFADRAEADPVLGLGLAIDGSGSIAPSDFTLQQQGYVNALDALLPVDGTVAIYVNQFSTIVQEVFPATTIDSQSDKDNLLSAIGTMVQLNGVTSIGDAIIAAQMALIDFTALLPIAPDRLIIDVSTDGFNNNGADPIAAALAAIGAGIDQVNCLGVGGGADCSFAAGTDNFTVVASDFSDFENAITTKLAREIGDPDDPQDPPTTKVPEPVSLSLLGMGLGMVGLAGWRRRRQGL